MKKQQVFVSVLIPVVLLFVVAVGLTYAQGPEPPTSRVPQAPLSTAFAYQGQLKLDGEPVNEECDFQFGLHDAASLGTQIGITQTERITVTDGLFTAILNDDDQFGAGAWNGDARWLEIHVKCPNDTDFADLGRQELTATPYAHFARSTGALHGQPVTTTAPSVGQVLEWDGVTWGPALDDDITVHAGPGLSGGSTGSQVTLTVAFSGTGSADLVARSDHDHDGFYSLVGHTHTGDEITSAVVEAVSATWATTATYALAAGPHSHHALDAADSSPTNALYVDNEGRVGIGTITPLADLHVGSLVDPTYPTIVVYGTVNRNYAGEAIDRMAYSTYNADGPSTRYGIGQMVGSLAIVGYEGSTGNTNSGNIHFFTGNSVQGYPSGYRMSIRYDGNVGIGTTDPGTRLDVSGAIRTDDQLVSTLPTGTAPLAVDSTTLVDNLNADMLDGQHGSSYQQRVSGVCAVGSTVQGINADGTVECAPHAPRPGFLLTNVDSAGNAGVWTSVAIGVDGLGLISHRNNIGGNGDLRVAHCNDLACTSTTNSTVDTTGDTGCFSSLAIGADGLGLVAYTRCDSGDLMVAHCDDIACTSATITTLDDSAGLTSGDVSVAIGTDGLGLISYVDQANDDLRVAHCTNVSCTLATTMTADTSAGHFVDLTIGADGLGLIAYQDASTGDLKTAHCINVACTTVTTATVDTGGAYNVGAFVSIARGADGLGLISYQQDSASGDLVVGHCNDIACTSITRTVLDTGGSDNVGGDGTEVTIGSDGLGLIAYANHTQHDLKVAHCNDIACTSATITTVESSGSVGHYCSITIGTDGFPLISHLDVGAMDLRVAHCSNWFCTPYFRQW